MTFSKNRIYKTIDAEVQCDQTLLFEYSFETEAITCILLDFSLTVKAATLKFISGCGRLFHLLRKGNQVFSFLSRANVRAFHENPNRIHTELTFINP